MRAVAFSRYDHAAAATVITGFGLPLWRFGNLLTRLTRFSREVEDALRDA